MIYNIQAYSPVINPALGEDGEPDCFLTILPANNASLPAITAYFIAFAILIGSFAQAIAVFIRTPSQPNSIAMHASLAVPTPASTMIGTVADGGIGPNTLKCLDEYIEEHGLSETIENFQSARQEYYESLSTFETFGRGWTRRVEETTESALEMI